MKPELAALLLVEEYNRRMYPDWMNAVNNPHFAVNYRHFLESQANNRRTSKGYGYYLAVRQIESGQSQVSDKG